MPEKSFSGTSPGNFNLMCLNVIKWGDEPFFNHYQWDLNFPMNPARFLSDLVRKHSFSNLPNLEFRLYVRN